ncbi:MAG TPA: L,D-transpeptidase family protein [Syntrophorhabdaceae bacterium]|nr:L,D-transpeptidase family protein [Syntrophorhabdaceae bacterium]
MSIHNSFIHKCWKLVAICALLLSFTGCALLKQIREIPSRAPVYPDTALQRNDFTVSRDDDVVGGLALMRLEPGDTLPDVARHFSVGLNSITSVNPEMDVWVPETGKRIILPLSFILPDAPRKGIVINLAAMRLFYFKQNATTSAISTYPIGVGTVERPSPMGQMYIDRKMYRPTWFVPASIAEDHRKKGDPLPAKVPPGPLNPLGEHALYLSKSGYLIHGTNKPASIGLRATNGCMRLYPEDIKKLFETTPVRTPVTIVNQPYLIGRVGETIYMEVHNPFEESGADELEKAYIKLKNIEAKSGRLFDWTRIKEIVKEARGVPVPIFTNRGNSGAAETIEIRHPEKLHGKPEVPELRSDRWYVLAANSRDKIEAMRIAAIINHQGPQIPARVLSRDSNHRVLAGPFDNNGEAREALKRLRIDLEITGILIEPFDQTSAR